MEVTYYLKLPSFKRQAFTNLGLANPVTQPLLAVTLHPSLLVVVANVGTFTPACCTKPRPAQGNTAAFPIPISCAMPSSCNPACSPRAAPHYFFRRFPCKQTSFLTAAACKSGRWMLTIRPSCRESEDNSKLPAPRAGVDLSSRGGGGDAKPMSREVSRRIHVVI